MNGLILAVGQHVQDLDDDLPALLDDCTVPQLLEALAQIRQARQHLARLEAIVERHTAQQMEDKRIEWDGGYAERRKGAIRKHWLHDDLAHVVTVAALVDPETGELPGDEVRHAVERAVSELMNTASVAYWRVGQLKRLGIDVGDYCHTEPGRTTVEVHLATDESEAA